MSHTYKIILFGCLLICACSQKKEVAQEINEETEAGFSWSFDHDSLIYDQETHFSHMQQLTNGGDNAEAYWSFDDRKLTFQATNSDWGAECDQIFIYDLETKKSVGHKPSLLSTGKGRTTCSFFMPGNDRVIFFFQTLENTILLQFLPRPPKPHPSQRAAGTWEPRRGSPHPQHRPRRLEHDLHKLAG